MFVFSNYYSNLQTTTKKPQMTSKKIDINTQRRMNTHKRKRPNDWENDSTGYEPPRKLGHPIGTKEHPILLKEWSSEEESSVEMDSMDSQFEDPDYKNSQDLEEWFDQKGFDYCLEEDPKVDLRVTTDSLPKINPFTSFEKIEDMEEDSPRKIAAKKRLEELKKKRSKYCGLPLGEESECSDEDHKTQSFGKDNDEMDYDDSWWHKMINTCPDKE